MVTIWRGFKDHTRPHAWKVVEGDLNLGVSNSKITLSSFVQVRHVTAPVAESMGSL